MSEAIDVVIAGTVSIAISWINYLSIKKDLNNASIGLTDKRMRRQQKLAQRELWEHAAYASALGIALFIFFVFNATTDMSHYPLLPRLVVSLLCLLALLFVLRLTIHAVFRYVRTRSANNS